MATLVPITQGTPSSREMTAKDYLAAGVDPKKAAGMPGHLIPKSEPGCHTHRFCDKPVSRVDRTKRQISGEDMLESLLCDRGMISGIVEIVLDETVVFTYTLGRIIDKNPMRKRMIAAVIIALTVIVPAVVFAAEREKTVILPEGDTVSDNFVAFGETIEISGTVEGDVYAFGSSVILTSTGIVNGDFISAGSTVDIWGNVLGNVRAAGSTVTLTGSVGRNMSAAGSTVRIESNGVVGWSTQLVGNTIVIAGTVAGQANAYGNDLRVDGTVGGDTQMTGRTITVSSDATLNGDLTYRSDAAARISDSATIGGTVIQKDLQTSDAAAGFVRWMRSIAFFAGFFGTILVGLLLILVLPKTSARTIQEMRKRSWQHILIGIALLIGVPIIAGLLMATIVGIPLALVILALYVMFLFFGKIYAGWMLGAYLKDRLWKDAKWHSALVMLFGVTLLLLIGYIPFLGPLIVFIGTVWGFSAYVAAKMSVEKEAK